MTKRLVFGLTGQSNMVGYQTPPVSSWPVYPNASRIFAWQNGVWVPAKDPLGPPGTGVGPGMSFANELINLLGDIEVGLVMTAVGGTYAGQWIPFWFNVPPWYYGVALALLSAAGPIAGLIDYQGENDASSVPTPEVIQSWVINKRAMIAGFRSDLGLPTLPAIITRLGPTTQGQPGWASIQLCADQFALVGPPNFAVVSASDLMTDSSGVHLDAPSQLTLGQRYAAAMAKLLEA